MTKEHYNSIIDINALLCQKFKIVPDSNTLIYHHWWDLNTGKRKNGKGTVKSCPGTAFFGGNTVEDAEKYFIPFIKSKLELLNKNKQR